MLPPTTTHWLEPYLRVQSDLWLGRMIEGVQKNLIVARQAQDHAVIADQESVLRALRAEDQRRRMESQRQ